ncbi:MAG: thymidine phosphorylase [Planctomycetota bacterium]|nr:thymidine phosphorylase [Planctomycetota bacterium]
MDVRSVLRTKRDGGELSEAEITFFMRGYVEGEIPDYAASALLMSIFVHGMGDEELEHWTRAMLESGSVFSFDGINKPKADKHSTGGVGDKVSIPLAPAVAACGVAVPMISGRGLGHTGGTLDKLEAIPGFRTQLSESEFARALERTGVAFGGQTEDLVPADRKLYALRDVTGLIESVPLIASSILSKKLAEGIDALVLDVKFGSGAFLPEPERGAELARTMIDLGGRMGLSAVAFQTAMDRPLGGAAGHALEIAESIECLKGRGPDDLRELVVTLGGAMLAAVGEADGEEKIARVLDDGSALEVFACVVAEQAGDPRCLEDPGLLPRVTAIDPVAAERDGVFGYADVREVGRAVVALGGGRTRLEDAIDPAVGVVCLRQAGTKVGAGDELFLIHHREGRGLAEARAHLTRAIEIGPTGELSPLVLARLDP